jgi:signal transduction histidine kinase
MYFTSDPPVKAGLPLYKTAVCLVCVLILIFNGISLFRNLGALRAASQAQTQTAVITEKLQNINLLIMDAESSLRGYFLSSNEVYLGPLRTAASAMDEQFDELEKLLVGSPAEHKNLIQLRRLVSRKLDNMNQTLDVFQKGGLQDVVAIAANSESKYLLDEIGFQVTVMVREQNLLLGAGRAAFYQQYRYAVMVGIGINAMAILVLGLFYRLIRRGFYVRVATQRALENANNNLESMVVLRTEQLSVLSRHLISVSEDEKARLARELHDEMGANLTAINIDINAVADQLRHSQPALAAMLERARATLVDTVELKRRIVENLRPSMLDNLGLSSALHSYCADYARVTGLDCEVLVSGAVDEAGPMQSIAVFRIVQESLNNIAKYAQARHVIVQLAREGAQLALEVIDDGIGIDADAASQPKSHGLLGMRERALLLGGTLRVRRGVAGHGTCVEAVIPVVETEAATLSVTTSATLTVTAGAVSAPRPSASDRTPSSPPCSTRPHTPQDLDGQLR